MDPTDNLPEPNLDTTPVDFIFALSYSSRQDNNGDWNFVKSIWDEAVALSFRLVGPRRTIRLWVDKVDRKRRSNEWSFVQIYPYLVWPVLAIVSTFIDRFENRTMRMWPAMECTAGLVGEGLFCTDVPNGTGPVLQTMVRDEGVFFNQRANINIAMKYVALSFAAHIQTYRFRDYASFHVQQYVNLNHHTPLYLLRREFGSGFYAPLVAEEPDMLSKSRHEMLSMRWQPLGNMTWSNDIEWAPMESGIMIFSRKEGVANVNPDFEVTIYRTGRHRLDQRMGCVSNEHGRKLLLLLEENGGPHGRVAAFFRYPSFFTDEQAIRLFWTGWSEFERMETRDSIQWPANNGHMHL